MAGPGEPLDPMPSRRDRGPLIPQAPVNDPFQTALKAFTDKLNGTDTQEGVNPQIFRIGQTLVNRGLGTQEDPLIAAQRAQASNQLRTQLGRQGFGNSTIADNEMGRLGQQFDLASIARQDQLLQGGLGLGSLGLQNLTALPQLLTAQTAAQNAGRGGGGGGGKK